MVLHGLRMVCFEWLGLVSDAFGWFSDGFGIVSRGVGWFLDGFGWSRMASDGCGFEWFRMVLNGFGWF